MGRYIANSESTRVLSDNSHVSESPSVDVILLGRQYNSSQFCAGMYGMVTIQTLYEQSTKLCFNLSKYKGT